MTHKKALVPTAMIAFLVGMIFFYCLVKIAERGFDFGQFLAGMYR
jgi:hypothetical protein